MYVFFSEEAKIGVKEMRPYTERMIKEKVFQAIFVVQQILTSRARSLISEVSTNLHLEFFQVSTLLLIVEACFDK